MARSVNKVILLGNAGRDPDVRSTPSGAIVAEFTLATTERHQDQAGQWTERTEWHRLVAFAKMAELVRDNVKKGTRVYVEGKLETRSWDDKRSGEKKYQTQVRVNTLVFADDKNPKKEENEPESSWSF